MTISSISASIVPGQEPRFQKTLSFEEENPKRVPVYKTSTTNSDGSREITVYYSDKTQETRTEKPIKADIVLKKIVPGQGGILV